MIHQRGVHTEVELIRLNHFGPCRHQMKSDLKSSRLCQFLGIYDTAIAIGIIDMQLA